MGPRGIHGRVLECSSVHTHVYIAKGSPFGRFSETPGMTSEERGSRTSNTDFSIARILANDCHCFLGAPPSINRKTSRKRREQEFDREHASRETNNEETRVSGCDEAGWDDVRRIDVNQRDGNVPARNVSPIVTTLGQQSDGDNNKNATRRSDLTWLQYTRYRPPKLPRKSVVEKRIKRRTGEHPRIPFSSSQLRVLEDRYKRNAYLSRNDVVEMSATLRLPQSKVCQIGQAKEPSDLMRQFQVSLAVTCYRVAINDIKINGIYNRIPM